jgi:glycosyltransferase involved in cell wall biosynthesis
VRIGAARIASGGRFRPEKSLSREDFDTGLNRSPPRAWSALESSHQGTLVKILIVHNFYQQTGGEDLVVGDEIRLLESRGHEVLRYTVHNDQVGAVSTVALAQRTIWNQQVYRELRGVISQQRPQVVHVHNTLPLLSPSVYYAADAERVAVVQTLHNYRLLCPSAVCFRDGHVCTDCLGKPVAWPAIRHACYRGSRSATAAVVTMLSVHRLLGTWHQKTSVYIVLTELARRLFMRAGLPADKLVLKPNFVEPDPGLGTGGGGYAIFVGRLSSEKGITVLLDAWRRIGGRIPLRIVGDGPLSSLVAEAAVRIPGVTWLGRQTREEIASLVGDAACLVFPSECYETFGRVIVEAFAGGTPVLAADHGAGGELVSDGITGLLFRHGDAHDLADKVIQLHEGAASRARIRAAARKEFEDRFTAAANYRALLDIYARAMHGRTGQVSPAVQHT